MRRVSHSLGLEAPYGGEDLGSQPTGRGRASEASRLPRRGNPGLARVRGRGDSVDSVCAGTTAADDAPPLGQIGADTGGFRHQFVAGAESPESLTAVGAGGVEPPAGANTWRGPTGSVRSQT